MDRRTCGPIYTPIAPQKPRRTIGIACCCLPADPLPSAMPVLSGKLPCLLHHKKGQAMYKFLRSRALLAIILIAALLPDARLASSHPAEPPTAPVPPPV